MPLDAPALLLTRPAPASEALASRLRYSGKLCVSPLMRIVRTELQPQYSGVTGLLFTSSNAVTAIAGQENAPRLPAWCVGHATAAAARKAGFEAFDAGGTAEDLKALVLARGETGPLLHVRGAETRGDLAGDLTRLGVPTRDVVVYRQDACALNGDAKTMLLGKDPVVVPLFSPRTAQIFANAVLNGRLTSAPLFLGAISDATAAELKPLHCMSLEVSESPDLDAMVALTLRLIEKAKRIEAGEPGV